MFIKRKWNILRKVSLSPELNPQPVRTQSYQPYSLRPTTQSFYDQQQKNQEFDSE